MSQPTITGWKLTDSVAFVACPRCEAQPGKPCRSNPSGHDTWPPHVKRIVAFTKHPAFDADNYRLGFRTGGRGR